MAESRIRSFDDVIAAFGGPAKYAEAINIEAFHAQTMKNRGSIPPGYWRRTIDAAKRLGLKSITEQQLIDLAHAKAAQDRRSSDRASA